MNTYNFLISKFVSYLFYEFQDIQIDILATLIDLVSRLFLTLKMNLFM